MVLKGPSFVVVQTGSLLRAGVFGHSLGSLRHGVFWPILRGGADGQRSGSLWM